MSEYDAFIEIGSTGLNRWGNMVAEEFLSNLRGAEGAKVYQEMADNDATVGAVMYMSEQLIRQSQWSVQAGGANEVDLRAKAFLESCMNDMSHTWANLITEALSSFTYGWSFHEIVYKMREDGLIGWKKMPIRSQSALYGWEFEEDGGVSEIIFQLPPTYRTVRIPMKKGLLFRTKVSRDNPEGRSMLRNAYRPYYFKKRIEEIEGIGIERDLAGLPVIQPPENVDLWDDNNPNATKLRGMAETVVRNVRRDQSEGLVIPHGWEFKLMSTGGARQFDTNAIINRYDQRIAITMLADIVMLGADKVGSFALADVKKSLLAASLEAQIQNIADVINKFAVTQLFEYNAASFAGMTALPKVVPEEIESASITEIGEFLQRSGMPIMHNYEVVKYIYDLLGLPELTEEMFAKTKEVDTNERKTSDI